MAYRNLLKQLQDSVYVVEENGKKVNNNEFNRIVAPIYSQNNTSTPIAPIKKQNNSTWFQKGAFNDGYDFGDVTKTILGTGIDTAKNFTKGVLSVPEGMLDFGTNMVASGLDLVGAKQTSDKLKDFAQKNLVEDWNLDNLTLKTINPLLALGDNALKLKENLSDGFQLKDLIDATSLSTSKTLNNTLNGVADKYSVTGDKSDSIVQGVGQLTGQMAGQALGIPWQVTAFTSSAGQEMNNAFANNASAGQAFVSGLISGSSEVLTEYVGGGANKLLGMSSLGSKVIERLGSKISNKLAQRLIKFGIDAGSEGLEEVLSGYGTAIGQKLTYMNDKDINELYSSDQALDDFIGGVLVSGIGNIPGNIRSIKRGENAFTGYTQNEEKVLNALTQEQVQEKQNQTNKTVPQKEIDKIRENIENQMEDGKLDGNKINDIIGENISNKDVFLQKSLTNSIQNTSNLPINSTVEQQNNNSNTKYSNNSELSNMLKYEATDNEKINSFRKSLINENVIDNEKTRNAMNVIEKVIADKDYNVVFDSSITNAKGDIVDGKISINENGETDIRLNPNSDRAVEFLLVHEITHAIENNELRGLVLDYASQNKEFSNVLKDLQNTYNTTEVSDEVLADISGQILGNQEFIKSLSTQNTVQSKNTIRKIYESIRRLLNKITTNGRYKNFVQDLETKWREAYSIATNETAINNLNNNNNFAYDLDKFTEKKGAALDKSSLSITTGRPVSSSSSANNIPQSNQNVKSGISTKYSMQSRENNTQELDNSSFSLKEKQLEIIKNNNPAEDDYHTWIRNVDDIKLFEETLQDSDWEGWEEADFDPDYTSQDVYTALETGKITVYSSYPIEQGIFVTPSKMEAESYSGNGKTYSKTVDLKDIAWIDPTQGQYAKVDINSKYSQKAPTWKSHLEENYKATGTRTYFDEITKANEKAIAPIAKEIKELSNTVNSLTKQIAPIAKENNTIAETKQNIAPIKKTTNDIQTNPKSTKYTPEQIEISKKTVKQKLDKAIQNQSIKAINTATKVGDSYIEFTRKEKSSFKEQLSKYSGMTKEQLMNAETYNDIKDIVKQYADKTINYTDTEIANLKKEIRKQKIKIDENLKNQIDDYGDFKKQNFGKLTLSNEGQSADGLWQELSNQYPHYFSKNVQSEADMLYQLSEFMSQDTTITEKYRLDDDTLGEAAVKVYNSLLGNTFNNQQIEEMQNYLDDKSKARTKKIVQDELLTEMGITQEDLNAAKDINQIAIQRTDPIRLNEKVFGYKIGKKINDATINKTKHNEADRIRFLNQERNDIESLGIKARSKESAAVQKYAEKKYINEYGQEVQYGDNELMSEFSDVKTQEKIKRAAEMLRNKYDTYIDQINDVITNMGYDEIPKRTDYMRHFSELNDKLSKWGIPLNRESVNSENLPTDINGITDQFKPGKNWFASAMQRTGEKTTYDAITGIDGYLEGASNLIYHTEDIQRYRALSKMIRETFGQSKGFDNLGGLSDAEIKQRIKDIQNNKFSNYVAWLDEQANSLAGKKGGIDRAAERLLGRKIYSILDTAKKQVGSNMTGFNFRSALTNFASSIQGASKTNKIAFLKGTISTVENIIHNDGLIDKSDFLTSRFGSNQLSSKLWQKISNAGQILMTGSDYFTSNQIWRSKYYENLSNGMSEKEAIKNADDFSARIMGDRSKGATAEIFNSKTLGILTQFQLEVNNQWSSLVHDNKMDIKSGNKSGATVLFQLGQLAAASYFFNNLMKSLTGSDVMIDPIDMLKEIIGANDDDEETTIEQRAQKVLSSLVNNLPFASILTGGRIPISEAFTGIETLGKKMIGETDKYGNEIKWSDVGKDIIESGAYWLLPTGYGQIRKTTKGISMYDKNLPVAGSYTDSGNLRFTADESVGGKVKAALFGQYSSKEAEDYVSSNYKTINANKIDEMKQLNMTSSEYRKYRQGLTDAGKTTDDNGYTKYIDNSNNTYWYDKQNKVVYDSNYNIVNKSITSLTKANKKEQVFEYINSLDMSTTQKNKILNAEYGGETTDSYGNVKYTREEDVYNNGLKKCENTKGTTYWVNTKTGYVYNTSGKLAKNYGTLTPVKEEKTYWYDKENKKLYDSKYNTVDTKILSSLTKEKKVIDISEYNKYSSFDEYEYASNNPDKYAIIKQITTYDKYNQYNKKIKDIKDNSINDKNEVIKYVNSLDLSIPQKAMFIKTYYKSFKTYDKQIVEYVNNQKLSMTEKTKILTELGFKMQNGIVVY